jgi:hypothetical protein
MVQSSRFKVSGVAFDPNAGSLEGAGEGEYPT